MTDTTPMLRELTIRYAVKADQTGQPVMLGQALTTPQLAAELLQRVLGEEATEVFGLVLLSTRHTVIATTKSVVAVYTWSVCCRAYVGTNGSSVARPR